MYYDPGKFDTGVIGEINAPGLVCKDAENECFGAHNCTVRIDIKMKNFNFELSSKSVKIAKILWGPISAVVMMAMSAVVSFH